MALEFTTQIKASVERVWSVLVDVECWPEWTPTMTKVTRQETGPLTVGSSAKVKQPRLAASVWTVTALDAHRSFTWQTARPGLRIVADHELTENPDGSVSLLLRIQPSGLLGKLLGPLTNSTAKRYLAMEGGGLKKRAEEMPES